MLCVAVNPAIDVLYQVARLDVGGIHRPGVVIRTPGGKALNVARAVRRLEADVDVVALLGGTGGRWIADRLDELGIGCRAVWCTAETRQCVSVLDEEAGALTEFYEPGQARTAEEWDGLIEMLGSSRPAGWIAVSGSMPPGVPGDALSAIVRTARSLGAPVAVDTAGAALANALEERPDVVKVNAAEARVALGADPDVGPEVLAVALAEHADVAVVTNGVAGAVLCDGAGILWRAATPRTGPFAVGCGDAFLAGLLTARSGGAGWATSLEAGVAAAAANALVPGAGCLDGAVFERLRSEVTVEKL